MDNEKILERITTMARITIDKMFQRTLRDMPDKFNYLVGAGIGGPADSEENDAQKKKDGKAIAKAIDEGFVLHAANILVTYFEDSVTPDKPLEKCVMEYIQRIVEERAEAKLEDNGDCNCPGCQVKRLIGGSLDAISKEDEPDASAMN